MIVSTSESELPLFVVIVTFTVVPGPAVAGRMNVWKFCPPTQVRVEPIVSRVEPQVTVSVAPGAAGPLKSTQSVVGLPATTEDGEKTMARIVGGYTVTLAARGVVGFVPYHA